MVASTGSFVGLSEIQHASTRTVVAYAETNPAALRQWRVAAGADLSRAKLLEVATKPEPTFEQWLASYHTATSVAAATEGHGLGRIAPADRDR